MTLRAFLYRWTWALVAVAVVVVGSVVAVAAWHDTEMRHAREEERLICGLEQDNR